jgi:hypothetical protein
MSASARPGRWPSRAGRHVAIAGPSREIDEDWRPEWDADPSAAMRSDACHLLVD